MLRRPVHASLVCGEREKREGRTEVGLHMYFVRLFVIFGAFATCSSVHPSRNWLYDAHTFNTSPLRLECRGNGNGRTCTGS